MDEIHDFRRRIDEIDDRILVLLGDRYAVVREVAAYEAPRGISAIIPERVAEVTAQCVAQAPSYCLDTSFVRALFRLLIEEAYRLEERLMIRSSASQ